LPQQVIADLKIGPGPDGHNPKRSGNAGDTGSSAAPCQQQHQNKINNPGRHKIQSWWIED